jgi:hypothetical protein
MALGDPEPTGVSVGTLVQQLVGDAREYAVAEVQLAKAKALAQVTRYKNAGVFFAVAGVLALAALVALLVGLILTLTPLVGPGFATLIVIGGSFGLAGILAWIGKGRLTPGESA